MRPGAPQLRARHQNVAGAGNKALLPQDAPRLAPFYFGRPGPFMRGRTFQVSPDMSLVRKPPAVRVAPPASTKQKAPTAGRS